MSVLDFFAKELRLARLNKGMSQAALAEHVSYSASLLAKVEKGERRPAAEFARRCDVVLDTGGLLERVQREIGDDDFVEWFRPWAAVEREAAFIRWFEPLYLPGLLQTEEYARAVLSSGALSQADEVEQQVIARSARQEVLSRQKPPLFMAVVDETALRRPVGGSAVMRTQMAHLRKMSELPRVRIQVVPNNAGAYPGLIGPFVIATSESGDEMGYLEGQVRGHVLDRPEDVSTLLRTWESIRGYALSEQQSVELISELEQSWS